MAAQKQKITKKEVSDPKRGRSKAAPETKPVLTLVPKDEPVQPTRVRKDTEHRSVPQFSSIVDALSALDGMLDELLPMRQAMGRVKAMITDEEARLRMSVKTASERHLTASVKASPAAVRETVLEGYKLVDALENHFEDIVGQAGNHFDSIVAGLTARDLEIFQILSDDYLKLRKQFEAVEESSDDPLVVASAYAAVINILTDKVQEMRDERVRQKIEAVSGRLKKRLSGL